MLTITSKNVFGPNDMLLCDGLRCINQLVPVSWSDVIRLHIVFLQFSDDDLNTTC